jgi:hypothetical protein
MALSYFGFSNNEAQIKQSVRNIAKELEAKHPGSSKLKVAILEFRTSDNGLTRFNQFIQDELVAYYASSKRFEIIDPNAINRLVTSYGWDLEKSNSFQVYSELSELIFKNLGVVPGAFIYGQVNDNNENITITGYLVPNGIKSTNIFYAQTFQSSGITDNLLGKPIRKPEPKPEPQVVIVEKPVVVEKQVVVEKPVYIEKEVVVEKPVYIEKPVEKPQLSEGKFVGKVGELEFELIHAKVAGDRIEVLVSVVNNTRDDKIDYLDCRFIDPDGNEFNSPSYESTLRSRDLIEGVSIKGTISFRGNNIQRTKGFTVIEINVYQNGKLAGTLRFRNVPVSQ